MIREAQTKKIPSTVVVGDKELNDAAVSEWRYGDEQVEEEAGVMFIDAMVSEVVNSSRDGKTKPGEAVVVLCDSFICLQRKDLGNLSQIF